MSDHFKPSQHPPKITPENAPSQMNITSEPEELHEMRVVKLDNPTEPVVSDYRMGDLRRPGSGTYSSVRAKFGALAATDTDKSARSRKDSRFSINSLIREPLRVEEEERRVIEERVRARVAAVSEEVRADAARKGYEDGLKKGFEEASRQFREDAVERMRTFDLFLAEAENAKAEIFRANERFLIDVIYRVARMVLLRELTTDREYILRTARELIERVGVRENIRIKINPGDLDTAARLKEGLEQALGTLKNLNIEPSNQVEGGGCIVETEWNAIDASIETQLQGIHDALLGN